MNAVEDYSRLITSLDDAKREALFRQHAVSRLERKRGDVEALDSDWPQRVYILLMRYLVGAPNREAAMTLARTVPYNIVMRECGTLKGVEALVIGASGLLDIFGEDDYMRMLRQEFAHLRAKYSLTPMRATEWQTERIYPNNHPLLRLAQAVAVVRSGAISMSNIVACSTTRDLQQMFSAPASDYWTQLIGGTTPLAPRIGAMRRNILGINFVAPIIYAYGCSQGEQHKETYSKRSLALLATLPAEDNRYMGEWISRGVTPRNALESQALLQLSTGYGR